MVTPLGLRRPRTPDYLRTFVHDLYRGRCLRCGTTRPLAVAHLLNWPTVRRHINTNATPAWTPQVREQFAFWQFHQPGNVVLLCCNCHTLLDNPKVTDVTLAGIVALRDAVRADPGFGDRVRRFVCREMGSVRRRPVDAGGLAPLQRWLADAATSGVLPPPHRFVVPWGDGFWRVDLAADLWEFDDAADGSLPLWGGDGFSGGG